MTSDAKRPENDAIQPQIIVIGSRFTGYPSSFAPSEYRPPKDDTDEILAAAKAAAARVDQIKVRQNTAPTLPCDPSTSPAAQEVTAKKDTNFTYLAPFKEAYTAYGKRTREDAFRCIMTQYLDWVNSSPSERSAKLRHWKKSPKHLRPSLTREQWLATARAILRESAQTPLFKRSDLCTQLIQASKKKIKNSNMHPHEERVSVMNNMLRRETPRALRRRPKTVYAVIKLLSQTLRALPDTEEMQARQLMIQTFMQISPPNYRPDFKPETLKAKQAKTNG